MRRVRREGRRESEGVREGSKKRRKGRRGKNRRGSKGEGKKGEREKSLVVEEKQRKTEEKLIVSSGGLKEGEAWK